MADSADPIVDAAEVEVSSIFSIPSDPPPQPELETLQEENEDDFGDFGDFEDAEWETAEATPTEPSETSQVEVPAPAVHISANPSSGAPDLLRLDKGGFLKAATAALSSFAPAALKHPAQGQVFTLAHLEARHPQMQPRRKESGQDTQPSPGWSKSPAGTRLLHRLVRILNEKYEFLSLRTYVFIFSSNLGPFCMIFIFIFSHICFLFSFASFSESGSSA